MPAAYAPRSGASAGVDLARLALGHAPHAERAHQAVGGQGVRPGELRQAAGGRAAEELELPQPVLAVAEPEREAQVVRRPGRDVRDAEAVAQDLERRVHAAQHQPARGLRQRAPEELEPGRAPASAASAPVPVKARVSGLPITADSRQVRDAAR